MPGDLMQRTGVVQVIEERQKDLDSLQSALTKESLLRTELEGSCAQLVKRVEELEARVDGVSEKADQVG